ncbi:hypothetical protein ACFP1C_00290 [Levilactobacillus fujinensis]|uniref:Uncharacterized protein n=2 Tax=Levilactobacillus fujinensis TaxID=2486024 RepID=A0ABW1TD12_9LACO
MAKWWLATRTVLLMCYLLWWHWVFSMGIYRGLWSWIGLLLMVAVGVGDHYYHQRVYTAKSWLWVGLTDTIVAVTAQSALNLIFGFVWYQSIILVIFVISHSAHVYRLGRTTDKSDLS